MAKSSHLFLREVFVYEFQTKAPYTFIFLMIHMYSEISASSMTKQFQYFPLQEILSTASNRQDTNRELHNSKHIPSSNTQINRVTQDNSKDMVRKLSVADQVFAVFHPDASIPRLK